MNMEIIESTTYSDGSGWLASVRVQGVLYVANFVNNRLTVQLGPYKHASRRPRWHIKHVTQWAEKQVAALTPEWLELHRAMYA
jgi:hypothetical protein